MGRRRKRELHPLGKPVAEIPENLMVYDAADWLPPDAAPKPDGWDAAAWDAWERDRRAAYARWQKARADWYASHELPPLEGAFSTPDESFDAEHWLRINGRRVERGELAAHGVAMLSGHQTVGDVKAAHRALFPAAPAAPVVQRNTTRRDKFRAKIRRGEPPCHLCGQEIDYRAGHLDPLSFTIDHIMPLALGGSDTLDNLAACHRKCNRDKSDKPPAGLVSRARPPGGGGCPQQGYCGRCRGVHHPRPGVEFETSRTWKA